MALSHLWVNRKSKLMPIYQKHGKIPHKRHVVFRSAKGDLYHEELFGTEGFSSTSSLVYHLNPPTMVKSLGSPINNRPEAAIEDNLKALSFMGIDVAGCTKPKHERLFL